MEAALHATASRLLVFGFGNPARGDDALGPTLLERLEDGHGSDAEYLTDFQLQVEHALDLEGRDLVLFIDAHISCPAPFVFQALYPAHDRSYTTHAMSPACLLQVYAEIFGKSAPPSFLLSIRGHSFELGDALSDPAQTNLARAFEFARELLQSADPAIWTGRRNDCPA